jgi:hypothetical protein
MVINIRAALDECSAHTADIRRRNKTLRDFYIYPQPIPTVIAAFDPPLASLQNRIELIQKLNFSQLAKIIDDPDLLAAIHLINTILQLLDAINGYKHLFERHYDPGLIQRAPYAATHIALDHLRLRLEDLIQTGRSNPSRPRAENLIVPHPGGFHTYHFCRSAIQLLNDNDQGLIANASEKPPPPLDQNGAFLFWKCPLSTCTFKQRFHILGSQASSIHNNVEIHSHPSIPLEYRATFLIKSHLHPTSHSETGALWGMRYGCLLCFAEGRPLLVGGSVFATGRELALHMVKAHKGGKLPAAMVLEKVKVAVGERCPVGVRRWDVNFVEV